VFAIWGGMDFTIDTNIAEAIDRRVLGHFRDGVIWTDGSWSWDPTYHYTWILSSLNFIVTVFLGCMAGRVLKSDDHSPIHKTMRLAGVGVLLMAVAVAMNPFIPIIKHIWSSSMTLYAGGMCFILMALFYYAIDVRGWRKGIRWLQYYGMNSLAAYVLAHVGFNSLIDTFFIGFKQWTGDYYPVVQVTCEGIIIFIIIRWMYKRGIFIKA
jgi:predicted acyltransferase